MRSTLTYNDVSSETIDSLVVTQSGVNNRPQRKCEIISVPGRSGDLVIYQDAYENVHRSYEITAGDGTDDSSVDAFYEVAEWLMPEDSEPTVNDYINLTLNGYHRLIDGADPTAIMLAHYEGPFDVENMLTRAGRATIDFSCRPERFTSDAFNEIDVDDSIVTYSGEIASFDGTGSAVSSLTTTIEPIQSGSGEASPDNVRAISGWSSVNVYRTGKNLLPYPYYNSPKTENGITFTLNADGSVTANGTATAEANFFFTHARYTNWRVPNGSYKIINGTGDIGTSSTYCIRVNALYGDTTKVIMSTYSKSPFELTDEYGDLGCYIAIRSGVTVNNLLFKPMICLATDTDDSWESPVNNETTSISLGQTVYGGTLNVTTGELTVTHGYADMGTLTWNKNSQTTKDGGSIFQTDALTDKANGTTNIISSAFTTISGDIVNNTSGKIVGRSTSQRVYCSTLAQSTVADFTSAMSGKQVVYELATPVTYTLSGTEITTLLGENNIWTDCGEVEVKFVSIFNPCNRNAKPFIKVYGSGDGTVKVNDYTITITGMADYLNIDCEQQNCYRLLAENRNNLISLSDGFPVLRPGANDARYSGGVTKVIIIPRWWSL